jgi:hypothetical protein
VVRNAIILLIALVVVNIDEAVECIIHVWYSALIRKSDLDVLQQRIRPLIENVGENIKSRTSDNLLAKTWIFDQRSLRLVLDKSSFEKLFLFTDIPQGLTVEQAKQLRTRGTLAESRKDYRDRHLLFQLPSRRLPLVRFREEGLLLPFGAPRLEFQDPNP